MTISFTEDGHRPELCLYDEKGSLNRRIVMRFEGGRQVESLNYDSAGSIWLRGVHLYDEEGRSKENATYDGDGSLVSKSKLTRNDLGQLIEGAEYDAKGTLHGKFSYTYNDAGEVKSFERSSYRADGTLSLKESGTIAEKNLALPESTAAAANPRQYTANNPAQLKPPIVNLARLILDFTSNPFFQEAGVVDTHAYQARRDLEDIIKISAEVRDLSTKLGQGGTSDQTPRDPDREAKIALAALRRQEIPEATLPCSPDEVKWWEQIRAVGNNVKKSRDRDGEKFLRLLKEGQEKSYMAPIPDRGPTFLRKAPPEYSEEGRRQQITGGIALVVDFLPDGTVGEVTIVQGLGFGMDEKAAEAARKVDIPPRGKGWAVRFPALADDNVVQSQWVSGEALTATGTKKALSIGLLRAADFCFMSLKIAPRS